MPSYTIEHPTTGQKITLTGDGVPSDADIREAFASVSKVTTQGNPDASQPDTEKMRQKFIADQGTAGTRIKEGAKDLAKAAIPYVRPVIEGAGAIGGGLVGFGSPLPGGAIAGTALGYAGAKNAVDLAEKALGDKPMETPRQMLGTTASDLATGATMEMGGQVLGKAIETGIPAVRRLLSNGVPLTQRYATNTADDFLLGIKGKSGAGNTSSPLKTSRAGLSEVNTAADQTGLQGQEAANLAQSQSLAGRLKLADNEMPTTGQMTGKFEDRYLEQGLAAKDPTFAGESAQRDSAILGKATGGMQTAAGKGTDLPSATSPEQIGQNIHKAVTDQMAPVQATMQKMEDEIPNAPVTLDNYFKTVKGLLSDPKTPPQVSEVIQSFAKKYGPENTQSTLHDAIGLRRAISIAEQDANSTWASQQFGQVRAGLDKDLDQLSKNVLEGKYGTVNGQYHDLDKLAGEFEGNANKIVQARQNVQPDYEAARMKIMTDSNVKQIDKSVLMGGKNSNSANTQKKIADAYKSIYGEEIPAAMNAGDKALIDNLSARNQQIRQTLASVDPSADAAAMYRAYNRYAKENYFDRFKTGAIERLTRTGNEAGGLATKSANITGELMQPEGAAQLIKAVGKDQAQQQILPHIQNQFRQFGISAEADHGVVNGLDVAKMFKYINDNASTLKMYGLADQANQMVKDAVPSYLEVMLNSKNIQTPAAAQKFINTILPNLRKAGYTADQVQAFRDFRATVDMLARNKNVTYAGNSTTIEKSQAIKQIDEMLQTGKDIPGIGGKMVTNLANGITATLAGGGAVAGHGVMSPVGAAVGALAGSAVKGALETQSTLAQKVFLQVLRDASYNPAYAKILMDAAKQAASRINLQLAGLISNAASKFTTISIKGATP